MKKGERLAHYKVLIAKRREQNELRKVLQKMIKDIRRKKNGKQ